MHVIFATGNTGKVASLERYTEHLDITIEARDLDLTEPQFEDIEDIARAKAAEAYQKLKQPVLVQDTGFYIEALNGFPGPYAQYAQQTIGAEGFIQLMKGKNNRKCKFVGVLAYADENGDITTFRDETATGTIAEAMDDNPLRFDAWSVLWHIFIPEGTDDVLNVLDEDTRNWWYGTHRKKANFALFADWLTHKMNNETDNRQEGSGI